MRLTASERFVQFKLIKRDMGGNRDSHANHHGNQNEFRARGTRETREQCTESIRG